MLLAMGCGASQAPVAELPEEPTLTAEAASPPSSASPVTSAPSVEEPPAPGAQLAGGRLGSVLPGLTPGSWTDIEGLYGPAAGAYAASDHVVERTTSEGTYVLHIVAWESFRQVPEGAALGEFARLRGWEGAQVVDAPSDDLGIAAQIVPVNVSVFGDDPLNAIRNRRTYLLGRLTVTTRGGTLVRVALACERSSACRQEDQSGLVESVAASLRRGPRLHGGGHWEVTLPSGPAQNRQFRIPLPDGFVGLPMEDDYDNTRVAYVISLLDGRPALTLHLSPLPPPQPLPSLEPGTQLGPGIAAIAGIACAPFHCNAVFSRDEDARSAMRRALAEASVETLPSQPTPVPLNGSRLRMQAMAPTFDISDRWGDTKTYVRDGDAILPLRIHDTRRPADEALTQGFFVEKSLVLADQSNVHMLPVGDPALTIRRVVPAEAERGVLAYLLVADSQGTGLVVEMLCPEDGCPDSPSPDGAALTADLALRLRAGDPPPTGETLRLRLGNRRVALTLPSDYTTTGWTGQDHGGFGVGGQHLVGATGTLEFEDSGAAQGASIENVGRATGRRHMARFGGERLRFREFRKYNGERIWGADLGCRGGLCVALIRSDDSTERRRLFALLAAAEVTPCTHATVIPPDEGGDEGLNLRRRPRSGGEALRQLPLGSEVEIVETRGSWARLASPNEGWVWNAQLARRCD